MQVGDVFAGAYRIEAEVARGGMGVVYRALDLALDRPVALKVMAPALSQDETYRGRFRREAAMAARIDHPHVVPVFHRGEHEGVMYVVMRLVDGEDLAQVLAREGSLSLERTASLVTQVAGGLDAAHALGLVHRDVKPANILLQSADRVLLTDFGLAKQAVDGEALTSANTLLGTAAYLSPEQAQGQALDGRCDVYALACVAFQCLTGRTPYPEGPALTVAQMHVFEPVPSLPADVAFEVAFAVRRGLAKAPADRWPSAGAFAAALQAASSSEPAALPAAAPSGLTVALPVDASSAAPVARPASRRTTLLIALGVAVVAAAGVGGFLLSSKGSGGPSALATPSVDRHQALIARLPASVYTDCHAAPAREVKGVVTAVDCSSTEAGAAEVLVSLFPGPAAMAADFASHYGARFPDGKCSRQVEVRSTWSYGPIACYTNSAKAAVLLYEYDQVGLQLLAVRSDGDRGKLYDWWNAHGSVPLTS